MAQGTAGMVRWYDPGQLLKTASEVVVSTVFGKNADPRLVEAFSFGSTAEPLHDYTVDAAGTPRDELWFDFMADCGDGWDSSYGVAYQMARPTLGLRGGQGDRATTTHRGDLLVVGGDLVYPSPSREGYDQRFRKVLESALPAAPNRLPREHPHLFAIPGNHDWYDSLVSFTRLFVHTQQIGGWHTPQHRSYFALKLPHNWWLLGVDLQLGVPLDVPQVDFFYKVAHQFMEKGDRIIVCTHEPLWIYRKLYQDHDPNCDEGNLGYLERMVLERKIHVFLAGDIHYYMRHQDAEGCQKIVSGGGGAFLHPTHQPDVSVLPPHVDGHVETSVPSHASEAEFRQAACYPAADRSKALTRRNLLFLMRNPTFGVLTAAGYTLTAWACNADIGGLSFADAFYRGTSAALRSPVGVFWLAALFLAFWFFTDTYSRTFRFVAGTLHGLAHVGASFVLGWLGALACHRIAGTSIGGLHLHFPLASRVPTVADLLRFDQPLQLLLTGAVVFVGGWIVGSIIMGLYLLISLNGFGKHTNEAFSSLRIADYKNFLRFHIDPAGDLTIYPVGIERVPREWKDVPPAGRHPGAPAKVVPEAGAWTDPFLIEAPITVPGRPPTTAAAVEETAAAPATA